MSFIQQFFTSRDNNANAETFVGQEGRLWWDPITNQIYSSDGSTPGGIPLAGGGGGNGTPGGANSQVQFNNSGSFGGSANLTFNRVNGALTAVSFVGDGGGLSNIAGANVVGEVTNATYASSAVNAINAETVTANSQPNINSLGILTELSVTGNVTADYFIGNGSQLTGISSGASNTIFNGNSNVAIATPNGNITITANTSQPYTWTFDNTGALSLAGDVVTSANLTIKTNNDDAWISQAVGANGFSQLYWTSNISAANPYNGNDDYAWAYVDSGGFFVTSRTVEPAKEYNWDFRGSDGALITPGKFITPPGNTSAIFDFRAQGDGGSSNLEFGADAPGSQYFYASAQDPVGRSAEFVLEAVDEGNLNALIRTSSGLGPSMQWDFTANGDLILPGDTAYIGSDASRVSIYSDINTESAGITVVSGSSTNIFNEGVVNIETNSVDVLRQWQFDQTGNLTIPGSIILPDLGSIMTTGYNNPGVLMANADSNWAYGFSGNGGAEYYTQVKFFGDHSTTRGFKILDSDSGNAWLFNGNGGLSFPDATVQSTAFTGTAATVTANAQPNITSVGTLTSVSVTGNVTGGNLVTAGNVAGPSSYNQPRFIQPNASDPNWAYGIYTDGASAFYMQTQFFGLNQTTRGFRVLEAEGNTVVFSVNGAGLVSAPGNVQGGNLLTGGLVSATGNITGGNIITGGAVSATANINAGNLTTTGAVYSNYNTNTANTASFMAQGGNTKGGTGYLDFLAVQNTSGGATVPYKWLRTTSDGQLQIINSAYTQNIFNLTDAGNVAIPGQIFINGAQTTNGPAFSAYAAAILQTIPNDAQTKVLFQTEEFDTNSNYANSRFTPTVAGYYQLNAEVRLDGSSGTGEMMIILYKNGAEYKRGTNQRGTQIASNFWAMQVSSVAYANGTGDYFEIYVQQGSGGSVTVTAVNNTAITWFNGCMLRGA